jgi:hypothetical protein
MSDNSISGQKHIKNKAYKAFKSKKGIKFLLAVIVGQPHEWKGIVTLRAPPCN